MLEFDFCLTLQFNSARLDWCPPTPLNRTHLRCVLVLIINRGPITNPIANRDGLCYELMWAYCRSTYLVCSPIIGRAEIHEKLDSIEAIECQKSWIKTKLTHMVDVETMGFKLEEYGRRAVALSLPAE